MRYWAYKFWRMIYSENRFPSPIGVEDMLFGIMREGNLR
jgi:hypothetical protein